MTENDIKKILTDLYVLDPSLRSREAELIKIIHALSINKPEAHYDPASAADLRRKLLIELAKHPAHARPRTLADILGMSAFRYATVAVIAVIAVGVGVYSLRRPSNGDGNSQLALNSTGVSVTKVGANAFGSLNSLSAGNSGATAPQAAMANNNSASAVASGGSTGASGSGMSTNSVVAPTPAMAPNSAIAMPIRPYYPPNVIYKYVGDPIDQSQAQLDVLKKVPTSLSADSATAALLGAGFGPVNLSTFSNIGISNVTLQQNTQYGYELSLDLTGGTVSINENYNEWPQGATSPLKASDIPATSTVIGIANSFLGDHHIATDIYGAPQLNTEMSYAVPMMEAAGTGSSGSAMMIPYFSDSEQVLYPFMVNGQEVYGSGGNPIGLTVEVNVRYDRVMDVYGMSTESYQSSAYNAITDASEILKLAENPQSYPIIYYDNAVSGSGGSVSGSDIAPNQNQTITYELGTPMLVYEDMYQSDSKGTSSEFLVPAYAFPILGPANGNRTSVIMVPLIQDFLNQNTGIIAPRPLPMETPNTK